MDNRAGKRWASSMQVQEAGLAMHEEIAQPEVSAVAMNELLMDRGALHFSEFARVSEGMMDGYAHFVRLGMPGNTVALAMLGAALNLYEMFGLRSMLPDLLRNVADRLESGADVN